MNRAFSIRIATFLVTVILAGSALGYPSDRRNPSMVWSDEAEAVVLFGGRAPADISGTRLSYGDTWLWDGFSWVRIYPEVAPKPRHSAVMVYDDLRDRVLLFGGTNGTEHFNDTWAFEEGEWSLIATSGPEPRQLATGAFDSGTGRFILYGGIQSASQEGENSVAFFDTWAFDGIDWSLVKPDGPQLTSPSMGYDRTRGEVILLGNGTSFDPETHRFENDDWVKLDPENHPPCIGQSKLVYREATGNLLTYGGACVPRGISALAFEWNGSDWVEIENARNAGVRAAYGLAYDEVRDVVVLYGGITQSVSGSRNDSGERGSTWLLSGDRWRLVPLDDYPGPRTMFVFTENLEHDGILLFGGQNFSTFFDDLWNRDSGIWELMRPESGPGVCVTPTGGVDRSRGVLVVLCSSGATWEWNGSDWNRFQGSEVPPQRTFSAMSWVPTINRIVLYGGFFGFDYSHQTWTYDGSDWNHVELGRDERPPARILPQMFFDPNSNRLILFGGIGRKDDNSPFERYHDQWYFDGSRWVEMDPAVLPPQRYGGQVAWDEASQRILMFGGKSVTEEYLDDMWAWDGSNWTEVDDVNPPAPRMNGRMVWDPETESVLLYGGYAGVYYSELWSYSDGVWTLLPEKPPRRARPVRR